MTKKRSFAVYKGLQKPLVYKGFKGRYMYWAIGFILLGLVLGGIISTVVNMVAGVVVMAVSFGGGIYFTSQKQKGGLYDKVRSSGIYVHRANLRGLRDVKSENN